MGLAWPENRVKPLKMIFTFFKPNELRVFGGALGFVELSVVPAIYRRASKIFKKLFILS
jgi:hypothetical protein